MSVPFCIERKAAVVLLSVFLTLGTHRADAQPRRSRPQEGPAYTDTAHVDEDYAFQGEYVGWQRTSRFSGETVKAGLQVIALGDGQFAATGYRGGLPGEGWSGGERQLFEGQRQGPLVEFEREGQRLVVDGQSARWLDADGRVAGAYRKVHRVSPTMGVLPPRGATVLFDGTDTSQFVNASMTADGLLEAGTETAQAFGDFRMHVEFLLPYKPFARGQKRGNSGIYIQRRYEVQVLDTFGLEGVDNECGALYKARRPDINMCYPPLTWQTYDIDFTPPRFDEQGRKVRDMRISVWHNGVPIHADVSIPDKTGAGTPEGPDPLPIKIQDHANPVLFRNIWLIERSSGSDIRTERSLAAVSPLVSD